MPQETCSLNRVQEELFYIGDYDLNLMDRFGLSVHELNAITVKASKNVGVFVAVASQVVLADEDGIIGWRPTNEAVFEQVEQVVHPMLTRLADPLIFA